MRKELHNKSVIIHETAIIDENVSIGNNTVIEAYCHLSSGCTIGRNCKIHRNVFIDNNVRIGNNVKIQNNNSIYEGVCLEEGAFIGTNVSFTNDKYPRSINKDGSLKTSQDWERQETLVEYGASIGSGATILCGITIGRESMVGAGAVVVHSVKANTLVCGNPAEVIKKINI